MKPKKTLSAASEKNSKSRKAPSTKTLRQLYLLSGNQCANPKCATVLINANGTLVADVCHIKAESPGGPRFDDSLGVEERRAPENLILLCNTCHTLVDAEPKKYTSSVFTKWKGDREARFKAVGDTLRQRYVDDIVDEAEEIGLTKPKTLNAYIAFLEAQNISHMVDEDTPACVGYFAEKLRHLALPDRELMRAIVEKAIALGGSRESEYGVSIHPGDLKTIRVGESRLSDYRIKKLAGTLERSELGSINLDEEPILHISVPHEDLSWSLLKEFLENQGKTLRDVVCDIKFGLLD